MAWLIISILFLAQVTNYSDKAVVGIAAPVIMKEFGLSHEQYGLIGAAFFSLYAVSGLVVAFLVAPRLQPRKIMTIMLIVWSMVQLPIVLAASFPILLICRTLLGMGESAAAATGLNVAHEWFPNSRRNIPSAIVMSGMTIGAMASAPLLTAIMLGFGWRAAFFACAVLGGIVALLWLRFSADGPYAAPMPQRGQPIRLRSLLEVLLLLKDPNLWGVAMAGIAAYWVGAFQVTWLAPLLNALTSDPRQTGWFMSWIFGVQAVSTLGVSFVAQRMMLHGFGPRASRCWVIGLCLVTSGASFILLPLADPLWLKLALVTTAIGPLGVFPLFSAIISEVTPPAHRNAMMTMILAIVTVAGIPASVVTGHLIDASNGGWTSALVLHGVIALVAASICFFVINPERSAAAAAVSEA